MRKFGGVEKKKHLLHVQRAFLSMKALFPQFQGRIKNGQITWRGSVTPYGAGNEYKLEIGYRPPARPHIRVISPTLKKRPPGFDFNHLYGDGTLCLYYPEDKEWTHEHNFAEHIVPWISIWLYFYEVWCGTGEWLGDSADHNQDESK